MSELSQSPPKSTAQIASQPLVQARTDGWGSVGPVLTDYHFGDILGLLGLALTLITFFQARSAKKAAKQAADTAIKARDDLETASQLAELAGNLRAIRDLYNADNTELMDLLKDRAVSIAMNTRVILSNDANAVSLMESIESHLRQETMIHKDEVKRKNQFQRLAIATVRLADSVELLKSERLKNGS